MKTRLDQAIVQRGLAATRSRARDLVLRGLVSVNGQSAPKPSADIDPAARIEVAGADASWVSRGAVKLMAALDAFGFSPSARIAVDVGASTGGFTQVLLQRGAEHVYAVDVGHSQLAAGLASDPRVTRLDHTDARVLDSTLISRAPSVVTADLSFISVTKALGPAMALATAGAWAVILIKPQFELTPADIGKGGVVRDGSARERAIEAVRGWVGRQQGWRIQGLVPSPIEGGSGNIEFLLGAQRD